MLRLPEAERNRIAQNLRLAEELGGETIILIGRSIAEEIVNFARQRGVSKIVSGKPVRSQWKDIFFKGPVDDLVRMSGDIAVSVAPAPTRLIKVIARVSCHSRSWMSM
jgi:two-component system sensor histidine kinase KdpD